ncbi:MAG: pentapeptide repeat-containing protein [Okeania sp. SIO2G4]|uniref:pentapeptide repeat-containing protein n=1 Tax=unclassified Okeania TaxID=2634635 RepID=UPI0013B741B6|nr:MULTISPECIES: pentapeptide repeat-containing protein [unclassified Okeania]NEP04878.1 pentapeptide repeat-containing protein [Okeania sp. SIO4D6]NEP75532.1 pentapeptide repeat-containing protein [Okeania sp. SIO2G5]NEP95356.1 pentapeptide repeat-containing protein [Okeania sp. SIO2F5]NEQ93042.1 pentapeptide repeat-containing protein [Okeania sp. SIO2G4]
MPEEIFRRFELVKRYAQGERNFTAINLTEVNLSKMNLSQSNFSNATLFVSNLSGANLSESNFSKANLNVARLSNANLNRAILNQATLNVANLVRTNLREATLVRATLVRGELVRVDMTLANLNRANLSGADMREAILTEANLKQANLSSVNLRVATVKGTNLEQAILHSADLTKADLQGADFTNAELRQANLSMANLRNAQFNGANLRWAILNGADLTNANLTNVKLSGANLRKANLTNTKLTNASLVHADLTEANLIRTDLVGVDLSGAILTGAKLYEVPRLNIKADEIVCEWIDTSPKGDHSQVYYFKSSAESKRFFSQQSPTVQIIVDSPLDLKANVALATTYYHLGKDYNFVTRPPTIEVSYQKTVLNFRVDSDELLFMLAFIVIFPFADAKKAQVNVIEIVENIPLQKMNTKILELEIKMEQLVKKNQRIQTIIESVRHKIAFFSSPTQLILNNSSGQSLVLSSNPGFGKKNCQNITEQTFSLPPKNKVIDFINSFYYLGQSL